MTSPPAGGALGRFMQALSPDGQGHGLVYHGYEALAHNVIPAVAPYAQDPAYLAASVASAALVGAVGVAGVTGGARLTADTRRRLLHHPGDVALGRRDETWYDAILRSWVTSRFVDRFYHMEVIAPTGGAKTSLLEYIVRQDLEHGWTVVIVEVVGDLAEKAVKHAEELGREVIEFNPSKSGTLKWNMLWGEKTSVAEQMADAVVNIDASKESFFAEFGSIVLRRMFYVTEAYARTQNIEPTIKLLRKILTSADELDNVLGIVTRDAGKPNGRSQNRRNQNQGPVTVKLEGLDEDTRFWIEHAWLGSWDARMKHQFTAGLQSIIENFCAHPEVTAALCPEPGEAQMDIRGAINTPGALVILRVDAAQYSKTAIGVASLLMQRLQQAAETRPDHVASPAMFFLDEIHNLLGFHNESIASSYSRWLTLIRKKNCAVVHAYQSYSLIPEKLFDVLQTNARSRAIGGGLRGKDVERASAALGHTQKTKRDFRRTRHFLSFRMPEMSEGSRTEEQTYYDLADIESLERGQWLWQETRNGRQLPPVKFRAPRAPKPRPGKGRAAASRSRRGEHSTTRFSTWIRDRLRYTRTNSTTDGVSQGATQGAPETAPRTRPGEEDPTEDNP